MGNTEKKEETVESSEPDPWLRTVTTNCSDQHLLGLYCMSSPTPVSVDGDLSTVTGDMVRGIVSPSEEHMAELQCDFADELWTGEQSFSLPVTNWSGHSRICVTGWVGGPCLEGTVWSISSYFDCQPEKRTVRVVYWRALQCGGKGSFIRNDTGKSS